MLRDRKDALPLLISFNHHDDAKELWIRLLRDTTTFLTNNYVLVETVALLQHRLGIAAVRVFQEEVVPMLQVDWISEERHRGGMEVALGAGVALRVGAVLVDEAGTRGATPASSATSWPCPPTGRNAFASSTA